MFLLVMLVLLHGIKGDEWRTLKKENPQKAHELRLKVI